MPRSKTYPVYTMSLNHEDRDLIARLRANLKTDHGGVTIAQTIRMALNTLAQFRGVSTDAA